MAQTGFWRIAARAPDAVALVDPEQRSWCRGELLDEVHRLTHGLTALGLQQGDAVAIMAPNRWQFVALSLAATQAGLYLVPINWHLAAPEAAHILRDSGARVFVADASVAEAARAAADDAGLPDRARFSLGSVAGFQPLAQLTQDQSSQPPEQRRAGAIMNYTSGTTGRPRGVRRALPELDPETMAERYTFSLRIFGIEPGGDNVHFCGSPLYHTAVLQWLLNSLHLGHAVVLVDRWDAEAMLEAIARHRVTTAHMVPTQFIRLLRLPEAVRQRHDLRSPRHVIHAAAPCPPDIKRAMLDWWGPVLYEYYAATEGGGTLCTPEEWLRYPGTVGRPWPTADLRILDAQGQELPPGEPGTVYMRLSEATRFEYKGDRQKTMAARHGDYFTVGDVGYLNEEGYLFLCDRESDLILSGGVNIYPAEIESQLILHPAVVDCAVFGLPNEEWGEEIKAVVQPAEGVQAGPELTAELLAFLAPRLARMKWPRSIDYVDALPRDPNGKLYKRRLQERYSPAER